MQTAFCYMLKTKQNKNSQLQYSANIQIIILKHMLFFGLSLVLSFLIYLYILCTEMYSVSIFYDHSCTYFFFILEYIFSYLLLLL